TQHGARGRHQQCRRSALIRGIANEEPQPAIFKRMEIVEVAAYLPGRAIVCRDPPSKKRRHLFGQQTLLDILSRAELLLDATALLHTRVLLRKRPLLRYTFDQLLRHRIELQL